MKQLKLLVRELIKETFQSHTHEPSVGESVINVNKNCKHHKSRGIVISIKDLPQDQGKIIEYQCTNSGPNWKAGDVLAKTMDQLSSLN